MQASLFPPAFSCCARAHLKASIRVRQGVVDNHYDSHDDDYEYYLEHVRSYLFAALTILVAASALLAWVAVAEPDTDASEELGPMSA